MIGISPKSLVCLIFILFLVFPVLSHSGDHSNQDTQTILEDHLSAIEEYDENNDGEISFDESLTIMEAETEGNLATRHQDAAIVLYERDAELSIGSESETQMLEEGWLSINEGDILTRDEGYPGYNVEMEATEISENGDITLSVNGEYEVKVNKGETVTGEELFGELGDLAGRGGAGLGNCGVVQRGTDRFAEGEANLYFDSTTASRSPGSSVSEDVANELDRCLQHHAEENEKNIENNDDVLYFKPGEDYTISSANQEYTFRPENIRGGTGSITVTATISSQEFRWSTGQDYYLEDGLYLELGEAEYGTEDSRFFSIDINSEPDNIHRSDIVNLFYIEPEIEDTYQERKRLIATESGNTVLNGGPEITSGNQAVVDIDCSRRPPRGTGFHQVNEEISLHVKDISCVRSIVSSYDIEVIDNNLINQERLGQSREIRSEGEFEGYLGERLDLNPEITTTSPEPYRIRIWEVRDNEIEMKIIPRFDFYASEFSGGDVYDVEKTVTLSEGEVLELPGQGGLELELIETQLNPTKGSFRVEELEEDDPNVKFSSDESQDSEEENSNSQDSEEENSNSQDSEEENSNSQDSQEESDSSSDELQVEIGCNSDSVSPGDAVSCFVDEFPDAQLGEFEWSTEGPTRITDRTSETATLEVPEETDFEQFTVVYDVEASGTSISDSFTGEIAQENRETSDEVVINVPNAVNLEEEIEADVTVPESISSEYQVIITNPSGEEAQKDVYLEVNTPIGFTPQETGEYSIEVYKTGRIQSVISRITGALESETFRVEADQPEWINYCRNNDYDIESIQQKATCIQDEIIPEYFEDSTGENPEIAESLCQDLLAYNYNVEQSSCVNS